MGSHQTTDWMERVLKAPPRSNLLVIVLDPHRRQDELELTRRSQRGGAARTRHTTTAVGAMAPCVPGLPDG